MGLDASQMSSLPAQNFRKPPPVPENASSMGVWLPVAW
jgi:hypothetical protein